MASGQDCCNSCPTVQVTNIPGMTGTNGTPGTNGADGANGFSFTNQAVAAVPASAGTNLTIALTDTSWIVPGTVVAIAGPSHYLVVSKTATGAILTWLNYSGDVTGLSAIPNGSLISPSGSVGPAATVAAGVDPTGVVVASPGQFYYSTTDSSFWIKETGSFTSAGWVKLIGMILFLCSLLSLSASQPPILRTDMTTNTETAVLVLVTNIARTTATNPITIMPFLTNTIVAVVTNSSTTVQIGTNAAFSTLATNRVASVMTNSFPMATNKLGLTAGFRILDAFDGTTNMFWFTNGLLYITNRTSN